MASPRYLLDTNVISELRKKRRSEIVVEWISAIPSDSAFISVVTVGEITKGIAKRQHSAAGAAAGNELQAWLDGLLTLYADRILPIDLRIAARWGRLCFEHPQLTTDMLLAATALEHGLKVASRNTSHFEIAGVSTFNPFD